MLPPYARTLGMTVEPGSPPMLRLPYSEPLLGRPGFLHGGVIAGMLEIAAIIALDDALGQSVARRKPINLAIDFIRGGRVQDSFARGRVIRLGGRIANVAVEAWQDDPARPIATARLHIMMDRAPAQSQ